MALSSPKPDSDDGSDGRLPIGWLRWYALAMEFLAYLGGLGYLGWWIQKGRPGWEPWGLLCGLLLGTGLGLARLIREAKRMGM